MSKARRMTACFLACMMLMGTAAFTSVPATDYSVMVSAADEYTEGTYGALTYQNYGDHVVIVICDYEATSAEIPAEIDGVPVTEIGESAFAYCGGLTTVSIPDSVTNIGEDAFYKCINLTSVSMGQGVVSIGKNAFYECTALASVTIPDSVTNIGEAAFAWCESLTSVTIPEGVVTIGAVPFYSCTGLAAIEVAEGNANYCSVNGALYDKAITKLITCPGTVEGEFIIPDTVTEIGDSAFVRCSGLTAVSIPDSVTSIDEGAFYECTGLASVTIPEGVTSIANVTFSGCTSLSSVSLPESLTDIADFAFYECESLGVIGIPESVTGIGIWAFEKTSWMEQQRAQNPLVIVNGILLDGTTAGSEVNIPEGVTAIGSRAFWNSSDLTSVVISDTVISIGEQAFYCCTNLTDVYYAGTEEEWNSITIDAFNSYLLQATIHIGSSEQPTTEPLESTTESGLVTLMGDLNLDNAVTIVDVIFLNKAVMGTQLLTDEQKSNADCDHDGDATAADSLLILKSLVDLITLS